MGQGVAAAAGAVVAFNSPRAYKRGGDGGLAFVVEGGEVRKEELGADILEQDGEREEKCGEEGMHGFW